MTIGKMADDLATLADAFDRRGDDDAWAKLRKFGEALSEVGGGALMQRVYDTAIERHGWRALPGVGDCWREIGGWTA